ncbi:hypothetical protein RJZ56_006363 [Blastomyces dermatitidis]
MPLNSRATGIQIARVIEGPKGGHFSFDIVKVEHSMPWCIPEILLPEVPFAKLVVPEEAALLGCLSPLSHETTMPHQAYLRCDSEFLLSLQPPPRVSSSSPPASSANTQGIVSNVLLSNRL